MRKAILILVCAFLVSCSTEIELKQPDYIPQIAVDGYIETDGLAHVYLTKSSPFLTSYDSASIRESFLNYAKITLTNSEGESEILTLFRESTFFPPFVYKSVKMRGVVGDTYNLKVELGGKVLTASTSIPTAPVIEDVYLKTLNDSSGILKVQIKPTYNQTRRIYIQVKSNRADKNFHPAMIPLFLIPPSEKSEIFSISRYPETNLYLTNRKKEAYYGWPRYEYAIEDTILIRVGTVDIQSYQILKSLFADQSSRENPFAFNRAGIQSNISGGIGRWTGIGLAPIQIYSREKARK